jgi:hypothetical protein
MRSLSFNYFSNTALTMTTKEPTLKPSLSRPRLSSPCSVTGVDGVNSKNIPGHFKVARRAFNDPSAGIRLGSGPCDMGAERTQKQIQPPRPLNAWIIYRQDKAGQLPKPEDGEPKRSQADVSKTRMWRERGRSPIIASGP